MIALVLAAGAGQRLGGVNKALLRAHQPEESFIERIVRTARAAGVARVLVVVGPPHEEHVRAALTGVDFARNPEPARGMLSSIQAGLHACDDDALVWPVDTPFVAEGTVRRLVAAEGLVVPTYEGRGGHPLRLPRGCFAEVLAQATTLRDWLHQRDDAIRLPVDDPGILRDVDVPADLSSLPTS